MQRRSFFLTPAGNAPRVLSATGLGVVLGTLLLGVRDPAWPLQFESFAVLATLTPVSAILVGVGILAAALASGSAAAASSPVAVTMRRVIALALGSLVVGIIGVLGVGHAWRINGWLTVYDLIAGLSASLLLAALLWIVPLLRQRAA